jgi:argininosuccinate lyase
MGEFASSIEVDLLMVEEDIEGSKAHSQMLGEVGLLSPAEVDKILDGLDTVLLEIRDGVFRPDSGYEDIHMAVEMRLEKLIGVVAGKLHTARSRNDQVATDLRLWLKRHLTRLDHNLVDLLRSILNRIDTDGQVVMPGYTHLQRGQPIFLGHHLLGHAWPIVRDRERLAAALDRIDASPLGSGALAGTPHPIDRHRVAELLGFGGVVENALDGVAARDHLQETASVCAIAMANFSRMAAELILWSSDEFRFLRLDQAFSTGSSIMPQNRNPDSAELIRGKTGRVFGDLVALLTLTKGLPLAYNRDLQEDREAIFDAVSTTSRCASILANLWASAEVIRERFEDELRGDPLLATELADALVDGGVPFREAHQIVGELILRLEREGRGLDTLTPEELSSVHPDFPEDTVSRLDPRQAANRRTSFGGTSWSEIERQRQLLLGLVDS